MGAMLAATLTLTNCTEEIQTAPEVGGEKIPYTIYADAADTKTVNDGFSTKWQGADDSHDADAINVFHTETGSGYYSENTKFVLVDAETGEFSTDLLEGGLSASNDWFVLYPYNEYVNSPVNEGSGYLAVGARAGSAQVQEGNDNLGHIAGYNYPMWGIARGVESEEFPYIRMTHLSSLVEVEVTNGTEESIIVKSVSMTGTEDITGTYYIDFSTDVPAFEGSGEGYVSDVVRLNVLDGEPIAAGASAKFYFAVKPFTAEAGQSLKLAINGIEKVLELSADAVFAPGRVKTLKYNFDAVIPVLDPGPYTSNMIWTEDKDAKAYTESATINNVPEVKILKLGTGSVAGTSSITIPAGTSKIGFYALSWNGKPATLALKLGDEVIGSVEPPANEGVANSSPYTVLEEDELCYFEITVNAVEEAVYTLTVTSSNKRVIIWGLNYYTADGTLGDDQIEAPVDPDPEDPDPKPEVPTVGEGTLASPYTVADALALIANAAHDETAEVYVGGVITSITEVSAEFGNATYIISDSASANNELTVFRGKYLKGEKFTSEDQIKVGDEVILQGKLINYKETTPELAQNNKIVSLNGVTGDEGGNEGGDEGGEDVTALTYVLGENSYDDGKATINGVEGISTIKIGTAKKAGSFTLKIPAGTKSVSFYAVAWKGQNGVTVDITPADGETESIEISANDGATSNAPYTITASDADRYTYVCNADTAIEVTVTSAKRVIFWDFVAE